ncbi:MAG: YigZ family protein [Bergeyella sp.]|nr:YigZ family protein [Bergeyella sp.]
MSRYKTIKKNVSNVLLKEKSSKFLGFACPVNSESEAKNYIEKLRTHHPKATHHCYAYRLGTYGETYRINDDGEPTGSAGLPIYNQLLSHNITHVLLVVVRYFGGTKLGIGGLIKAYKSTAKFTLDYAEIIIREATLIIKLESDYSFQHIIYKLLEKYRAAVIGSYPEKTCKIIAEIKLSEKEFLIKDLSQMESVRYTIE